MRSPNFRVCKTPCPLCREMLLRAYEIDELEKLHALEAKPVPRLRDRATTVLLAIVACLSIMGFAALFIQGISR